MVPDWAMFLIFFNKFLFGHNHTAVLDYQKLVDFVGFDFDFGGQADRLAFGCDGEEYFLAYASAELDTSLQRNTSLSE